jgi:hypothetical protein
VRQTRRSEAIKQEKLIGVVSGRGSPCVPGAASNLPTMLPLTEALAFLMAEPRRRCCPSRSPGYVVARPVV